MNRKRTLFLALAVILALCTRDLFSDAPRNALRHGALWGGIGVLNSQGNPVSWEALDEDFLELHLAAVVMFTTEVVSSRHLSFALDFETGCTSGQYRGAQLLTVPILLGVRGTMFPSSPVRLYGAGGAGFCLGKLSWSGWVDSAQWPFFPVYETHEETESAFAFTAGGGIVIGRGRRLLSIDYRYLAAPDDARLGGHLLCVCLGFLMP